MTAQNQPNLFLVAAPRSGSTQLATWLGTHPDIGIPTIKEPNYFSSHEFPEDFVRQMHLNDVDPFRYVNSGSTKQMQFAIFREKEHYEYLFRSLRNQVKVDASTTYLHCREAPAKILEYNSEARAIILTRSPVDRALSHYRLAVRTGRTTRSLKDELLDEINGVTPLPGRFLLRQSRYLGALSLYRRHFPPNRLVEICFEDMVADPKGTLQKLCGFLNLNPSGVNLSKEAQNAGDSPRFRSLNSLLMRSGVKTQLRNLLPISLKQKLKGVYFSKKQIQIPEAEISILRKALEGQ